MQLNNKMPTILSIPACKWAFALVTALSLVINVRYETGLFISFSKRLALVNPPATPMMNRVTDVVKIMSRFITSALPSITQLNSLLWLGAYKSLKSTVLYRKPMAVWYLRCGKKWCKFCKVLLLCLLGTALANSRTNSQSFWVQKYWLRARPTLYTSISTFGNLWK